MVSRVYEWNGSVDERTGELVFVECVGMCILMMKAFGEFSFNNVEIEIRLCRNVNASGASIGPFLAIQSTAFIYYYYVRYISGKHRMRN